MSMKTGALIAIAAGSLFAAACKKQEEAKAMEPSMAGASMAGDMKGEKMAAKVHCSGVNACKGHGACKSEANACAGKNGCAGKGWVELTEEECKAKNGTVTAAM